MRTSTLHGIYRETLQSEKSEMWSKIVDTIVAVDLPKGWRVLDAFEDGARFLSQDNMRVLVTVDIEEDGHVWMHMSLSRRKSLPSYEDMKIVKKIFVGDDAVAIQVFPAKKDHVNLHPNCLHLWSCLTGNPLPEFNRGEKSI